MTIRSMTGFGAAAATSQGWTIKVDVRSVNHRGLDVRVWSPREWTWVEPFVLGEMRNHVQRGRVEVRVDIERHAEGPEAGGLVDRDKFVRAANELREAARAASLSQQEPTIADVLATGDVLVRSDAVQVPEQQDAFEAAIRDGLRALTRSREEEGSKLCDTMRELLAEVARGVEAVAALAPVVGTEYQSRLESRLREALNAYGVHEIDEKSLLQEVALFADRSDVSEESQRARSHIDKLEELFADGGEEAPIGKQIDFYLQELMRETNTTGAKSGSIAITNHVIAMKSAVEQMREQAANIE